MVSLIPEALEGLWGAPGPQRPHPWVVSALWGQRDRLNQAVNTDDPNT
jgi:hypothetical protein